MRTFSIVHAVPFLVASSLLAQPQVRSADELIRNLKDADARTRRLAAEALGKQKVEAAVAPLAALLGDPDRGVREAAADALLRIGPRSLPVLIAAVGDENPSTRLAALSALERLGPRAKEAVGVLTVALTDKSAAARGRAAVALGKIGAAAKPALPALFEAAKDTARPEELALRLRSVAHAAINAALTIDPDCAPALAKAAVPALTEALASKDQDTLRAAAEALTRLGPHAKPALPALLEAQKKAERFTERDVRAAITAVGGDLARRYGDVARDRTLPTEVRYKAVWDMCWPRESVGEKTVAVLKDLLKDPDQKLRAVAVEEVGKIGPPAKSALPLLIGLLGDEELWKAAGEFGMAFDMLPRAIARTGEDAVPPLVAVLKDDKKPWLVRLEAARALGRMGGTAEGALPILEAALADTDPSIAVEAAGAYARIGGDIDKALPVLRDGLRHKQGFVVLVSMLAVERLGARARELAPDLAPLLEHEDQHMRVAAIEALCATGRATKPAVLALADLLKSDNKYERSRIAGILVRAGPEARHAVPALIERLKDKERGEDFTDPVLTALGNSGPDARAAVPALVELLDSKERMLVFQAIDTLGRIGPDAKAAAPRLIRYLDPAGAAFTPAANAARALGGIGPDAKEAVPALKELMGDEDWTVRVWAAFALARVAGDAERRVADLLELWKGAPEYTSRGFGSVRGEVLRVFELLGRDARPARDVLLDAVLDEQTPDWMRPGIARVLGHLGDDAEVVIPKLVALIGRPAKAADRVSNCCSAAAALGSLGPKAKAAVPQLRRLLADEDDEVAGAAAGALAKIARPQD